MSNLAFVVAAILALTVVLISIGLIFWAEVEDGRDQRRREKQWLRPGSSWPSCSCFWCSADSGTTRSDDEITTHSPRRWDEPLVVVGVGVDLRETRPKPAHVEKRSEYRRSGARENQLASRR